MSILASIFSKLFPPHTTQASPGSPPATVPGTTATATPAMAEVDVEANLDRMAQQNSQQLNWRASIVDMFKLLGLDSSLQSRKALATELHYTGDMNDSAAMNIWLHKQVMQKIEANGGKVPESLR